MKLLMEIYHLDVLRKVIIQNKMEGGGYYQYEDWFKKIMIGLVLWL